MVHRIKSKKFDCNIDNTGNCITSVPARNILTISHMYTSTIAIIPMKIIDGTYTYNTQQ